MAVITGTSGADTLADTAGNDTINGLAGNDTISGGNGGNDVVDGGDGRDSLSFATATSGLVVNFVTGVAGSTRFTNIEKVVAGDFNDQLTGNSLAQNLTAQRGDDTLWGAGGIDTLWGGAGADTFIFRETGTADADTLGDWTSGQDTLLLDGAVMTALGASGDFTAGDARFWASSTGSAHDADDRIIFNTTTRQIFYDADGNGSGAAQLIATLQSGATLVATDIAVEGSGGPGPINGGPGDDTLTGTPGNDTVNGLGGNDELHGLGGDDRLDGGDGNDWILAGQGADTVFGGAGNDRIYGAEYNDFSDSGANRLLGGDGDDAVGGGGANDYIEGNAGADYMWGYDGADTLFGADGQDVLIGQRGADTFVFAHLGTLNVDSIHDFESALDRIELDARVMSALGASGALSFDDPRFYAAFDAREGHDADDRIIYDLNRGWLYYDPDGSGSAPAQYIANLAQPEHNSAPAQLVARDIVVVNAASGTAGTGTAGSDSLTGTSADDTLLGLGGNDTLNALAGNDRLDGGDGNDSLVGGDGADTLVGGLGTDTFDGGLGDDWYFGFDGGESIVDAGGRDSWVASGSATLGAAGLFEDLYLDAKAGAASGTGNGAANYIAGNSENNTLAGAGGADTLFGGGGNDTLLGGEGNDRLDGGLGENLLDGGAGADTLFSSGQSRDTFAISVVDGNVDHIVWHDAGWDTIQLDGAVMRALGPSGRFNFDDVRFYAAPGATGGHDADDRVVFNTTNRSLYYDPDGSGSASAQEIAIVDGETPQATDFLIINGGAAGVAIDGTADDDTLRGTPGDDTINGFAGDDFIDDEGGNDRLDGGDGNDTFWGGGGNDFAAGGAGNDLFRILQDNETLSGGEGDDVFEFGLPAGATYNASLDGGTGVDLLAFGRLHMGSAVNVDLAAGTLTGGDDSGTGSAVLANIENVEGGFSGDRISGSASANALSGGGGNDTIDGRGGDDTLTSAGANGVILGGDGNDVIDGIGGGTLTGGAGADDFLLTVLPGTSLISDFASGSDELRFEGSVFTRIGPNDFAAGDGRFHAAAGATSGHDADDRIIYNTTTSEIFYDADGSGSGASQLVARLQSGAALSATDIGVDNGIADQTRTGTPGDDSIVGGDGRDTLSGLAGNDTLEGRGENDRIDGGSGNDSLVGGEGVDTLVGGDGDDILDGAVYPDLSADILEGGLGNDTYLASGSDTVVDSGGIDTLLTDRTEYTLPAELENLTFRSFEPWFDGEGYAINYRGNASDNVIIIGDLYINSSSSLDGGAGRDTLSGSGGEVEYIFSVAPGLTNADTIEGFFTRSEEDGSKLVFDGAAYTGIGASGDFAGGDARFWSSATGTAHDADDRVIYNTSNGQLWYDADGNASGAAQLVATLQGAPILAATDIEVINGSASGQVINGTSGADTLTDTAGNDTINGLAGNDTIHGGSGGTDVINGGDGRDSLSLATAADALVVDFVAGTAGTTSFTSIEKVVTGDFNDTLIGNAAAQNLTAQRGSDTLAGAGGVDTLWGGAGADRFIFRETGTANADTIGDWTSGADEFALDNAVLTALGAEGDFVAGDARFWASSNGLAHDANDRVIYNTTTRGLFYDADGTGSGAAQLIATVQSGASVAATDIVVI